MLKSTRPYIFVAVAVLLGYAVLQTFVLFSKPVRTEILVSSDAEDSIDCTGLIYRDEEIITQSGTGVTRYAVQEGQRVKAGVKIGSVYRSTDDNSAYAKIDELNRKIDRLKECMDTEDMYLSDSLKTEDNIKADILKLAGAAGDNAGTAEGLAEDLRLDFNRKQLVLGEKSSLESDLAEAEAERDALVASVGAASLKDIYSPGAGYFSQSFDGYENLLNPDFLNDSDYSVFKQVYDAPASSGKPAGYTGKLIKDFTWYFATVVEGDAIKSKTAGASLNLRLDSLPGEIIPVTLERVEQTADGYYCIFSSDYYSDQLVRVRRAKAQIILKTYSGFKINKDAIRMENEETGVYSLVGSQVIFKNVNVLFTKDNYSIITEGDGETVYAGEHIVVDGKNLFDGKVIT